MEFGGVFEGRKVLVLGATGFKGSWLCEWLLSCGATVFGIGLQPEKNSFSESHFEMLNLEKRISFSEEDIRNCEKLELLFEKIQPEIVFHLAAQAIVSEGFLDPYKTFSTNAMGTLNVLNAIRKTKSAKCAVIVTSDKCYENVEWEYGYREIDKLGGSDPYSASKACAEIIFSSCVRSFFQAEDSCRLVSVRAGNVIGGGDFSANRIVPDAMQSWLAGEVVELRNPNSTRPWQHVLEPLSGYLALAANLFQSRQLHGESFNLGPSELNSFSVENLVQALAVEFCKKETLSERTKEADYRINVQGALTGKESGLLKLSCEKINAALGWRSVWNFEETAIETAFWYKSVFGSSQEESILDRKKTAQMKTKHQIQKYIASAKKQKLPWSLNGKG